MHAQNLKRFLQGIVIITVIAGRDDCYVQIGRPEIITEVTALKESTTKIYHGTRGSLEVHLFAHKLKSATVLVMPVYCIILRRIKTSCRLYGGHLQNCFAEDVHLHNSGILEKNYSVFAKLIFVATAIQTSGYTTFY